MRSRGRKPGSRSRGSAQGCTLSACICRRENYVANTVWKSTKGVRQRISWLTGRGSRSFGEAQDDHFMAQAQRGSRSCQCSSNSFHGGGIPPLPLLNHRRNVQPRRSCSLAVWLKVLRQAELRVSPKSLSRWNGFKARSSGGALHLGLNKDEAAQLPGSARLLLPRRVAGAWSPTRGSTEQGERGSIWLSPRSFSGIPVYLEQAGARTTRNAGSRRMPVTLFATPLIPTYPPATPTAGGATDRTVAATRATKRSCPVVNADGPHSSQLFCGFNRPTKTARPGNCRR